eukprot:Skav214126  [mRNA]  locus=scaffold1185:617180:621786:- [translate_table: standard]
MHDDALIVYEGGQAGDEGLCTAPPGPVLVKVRGLRWEERLGLGLLEDVLAEIGHDVSEEAGDLLGHKKPEQEEDLGHHWVALGGECTSNHLAWPPSAPAPPAQFRVALNKCSYQALGVHKMTGAPHAGPCMPGNLLAIIGSCTSFLTVLIGLIYVYNKPPSFDYVWSDCGWTFPDKSSTDCNMAWQSNWGVIGVLRYTPLIFGIFGSAMFQPGMMQVVGFPRNFLQYGRGPQPGSGRIWLGAGTS